MKTVLRAWDARIAKLDTFEGADGKTAFVRLITSDGIEGWGQFGNKDVDLTVEIFHRRIAPAVMDTLVCDPPQLAEKAVSFELNYKQLGVQFSKALAGLDAAAWDACGKYAGCTVCELLGDKKLRPFPVYASSISRKISAGDLACKLRALKVEHGIMAFKVKAGKRMQGLLARRGTSNEKQMDAWPGRTEDVLREARAVLGPDCELMVDANGAYPSPDSEGEFIDSVCAMLRKYKVSFFEEAFFWCDYKAYESLNKRPSREGLPLAGGEQEFRMDVWDSGLPVDIYQPDFGYSGGTSSILQIADYAKRDRRRFIPHSPQGDLHIVYALHVASALSDASLDHIELACVDDGLRQIVLEQGSGKITSIEQIEGTPLRVKNGCLELSPEGHGWGVILNKEWLSASGVKHRSFDPSESSAKRSTL